MDQNFDDQAQGMGNHPAYTAQYQYTYQGDPGFVTDFPTDLEFNLQNTDERLPRSFSLTADPGMGSSWVSGPSLTTFMDSGSGMICSGAVPGHLNRTDDPMHLSSTFEDPFAWSLQDSPSDILLEPSLDSQSNPMLLSSGSEHIEYQVSEPIYGGHGLKSSNVATNAFLPETFTSGLDNPTETANHGQKRKNMMAKASSNKKHKIDSMIRCFPANKRGVVKAGRSKRAYSPPERKEIQLARNVGTCSRCRFRKVKFTFPRPCEECIRVAGSHDLARTICIRDTLVKLRFGGFDLLLESFTQNFLSAEIKSYYGPQSEIHLGLHFYDEEDETKPPNVLTVPIVVQHYSTLCSEDPILYHSVALDKTTFEIVQSERYAIVPRSIPSSKDILNWAEANMNTSRGRSVQLLITTLKEVMDLYCQIEPRLPLHDLLASSVRLLQFVRCWRCEKLVSGHQNIMVSKAVKNQIVVLIKTAIREEEFFIHGKLDGLIYGGKGPGKKNMIPIWACLWSLILTYRDCAAVYEQYARAPRPNTMQPGCSDHELVVGISKHMYVITTANYAALFRESSPLNMDWGVEANFDLIRRNDMLREAFNRLRTEFYRFYTSSEEFGPEDILLKKLVIDRELNLTAG